jgi:transcriptional regulator GlxA family with amidase domain
VIYGNALSTREDDEIYLSKTEEAMMATEQRTLIGKMTRLARVITVFAIMSGVFLLASAGVWVWIGLYRS